MNDLKYMNNSEIVCPYCDSEQGDAFTVEESGDIDCDNCGKEFYVDREVTITYSTSKS